MFIWTWECYRKSGSNGNKNQFFFFNQGPTRSRLLHFRLPLWQVSSMPSPANELSSDLDLSLKRSKLSVILYNQSVLGLHWTETSSWSDANSEWCFYGGDSSFLGSCFEISKLISLRASDSKSPGPYSTVYQWDTDLKQWVGYGLFIVGQVKLVTTSWILSQYTRVKVDSNLRFYQVEMLGNAIKTSHCSSLKLH